jgi:DNA polymerase-3 subunit epsilon
MTNEDIEGSIAALEDTGQFRVLRRAELGPVVDAALTKGDRIAILVDTETTGLDIQRDEVIELGMISFSYDADGNVGSVIDIFSAVRMPTRAIPVEITRLTGISNEMVAGRVIDKEKLESFLRPASLVIAHNAAFDRPMCEKLSKSFAEKPWACSATEIDWRHFGFEGTKLAYILNQFGKFHSGHRAIDDCIALLNILRSQLANTNRSVFSELLACARKTRYRISVIATYDMRSMLKARGYRWFSGGAGRPRLWWIELDEQRHADELEALRKARVPDVNVTVEKLTALNRYKAAPLR